MVAAQERSPQHRKEGQSQPGSQETPKEDSLTLQHTAPVAFTDALERHSAAQDP